MEMGERIKHLRQSKQISIYRLSQETGISQNHIRDLEQGRRKPSVETLRRLIEPLGLTLVELFNEDTEVSYLTDTERQLVENFRTLSDEKAALLLDLSRALNM